ncbi:MULTISPECIES: class I SAM-dependent methyltransferase [Gordonia]|uniref:S-adenosyl-L-methionine-dependent methyltransferase n=1 Tax=Gordonia sihwensis NBRC 108236 TaxID=1223544 RepID=L7LI51_9ACTN|nr:MULTISPECIES: SAM-dependent methyltransferase [Gordonia]AUH68335.1 class I SAM-dependent methyltransferase [Gordonia sp. YC-JH1]GAC60416.1 hypothetical protein GSI01S_10_00080 [Gordonia sihwensis NBRC 108236]
MTEQESSFSRTALFSAAARAAHALVDSPPHLLVDDAAQELCRLTSPSPLDFQLAQPEAPILAAARLTACARSRYAETVLAETGNDQVVVVGAGLDATALRLPTGRHRVWVVDRPGVLQWRTRLFAQADLADTATSVAADLADGLRVGDLDNAGVDLTRPVTVLWLGVSMYLAPDECRRFLGDVSALADGSALVFDYHLSRELRDDAGRDYARAVAAMAGASGEPWQCAASPDSVAQWLTEHGWRVEADIDEADATDDGFFDRQQYLSPMRLVRLVHAVR